MKWEWLDDLLEAHGSDLKPRNTLCFGAVLDFVLPKGFSVRSEPMFVSKGTNFKGYYGRNDFWIKTNYIEIPVLLMYRFGARFLQPYILAGPSLGIVLEAGTNDDDIGYCKEAIKSTDLSGSIGAGLNLATGPLVFFIEGRYSHGYSDLPKEGGADINNMFRQVLCGFLFRLNGNEKL